MLSWWAGEGVSFLSFDSESLFFTQLVPVYQSLVFTPNSGPDTPKTGSVLRKGQKVQTDKRQYGWKVGRVEVEGGPKGRRGLRVGSHFLVGTSEVTLESELLFG